MTRERTVSLLGADFLASVQATAAKHGITASLTPVRAPQTADEIEAEEAAIRRSVSEQVIDGTLSDVWLAKGAAE